MTRGGGLGLLCRRPRRLRWVWRYQLRRRVCSRLSRGARPCTGILGVTSQQRGTLPIAVGHQEIKLARIRVIRISLRHFLEPGNRFLVAAGAIEKLRQLEERLPE